MAQLCRSTVTWKYSLWRRGRLDEAHINMTDSSSQCPAVGFLVETATKLRSASENSKLAVLGVIPCCN